MDNLLKKKEQEELWEYCNRRPLYRPPITFLSVIEKLILTEFVIGGISACGSLLFYFFTTDNTNTDLGIADTLIYQHLFYWFLVLVLGRKKICISAIELYQHYAPESTRRKCICKPTCSEYAIASIQKYDVIKGSLKIIRRLFVTCRGIEYKIDNP